MIASCPNQRTNSPTFSPSSLNDPELGEIKATLEMMPRVTDWDKPAGLPIAKQTSPISTWSESPNVPTSMASLLRSSIRSSKNRQVGHRIGTNKSAITSSPSCNRQVIRVALPAT